MRPDIIVHRRGLTGPRDNLLLVEVKRIWTGAPDPDDTAKARLAIERLGYRTAVVVGLHRTARASADSTPIFDPQAHVLRLKAADHGSHEAVTDAIGALFSRVELAAIDRSARRRDLRRNAALGADAPPSRHQPLRPT